MQWVARPESAKGVVDKWLRTTPFAKPQGVPPAKYGNPFARASNASIMLPLAVGRGNRIRTKG